MTSLYYGGDNSCSMAILDRTFCGPSGNAQVGNFLPGRNHPKQMGLPQSHKKELIRSRLRCTGSGWKGLLLRPILSLRVHRARFIFCRARAIHRFPEAEVSLAWDTIITCKGLLFGRPGAGVLPKSKQRLANLALFWGPPPRRDARATALVSPCRAALPPPVKCFVTLGVGMGERGVSAAPSE